MKRILLIASILFLGISAIKSQNTCADQLKVAQRRFDDGLLDDIPQLLANCMKDGFTKEEKTNAYKLLIQTYLFSEQTEKADGVMLKFLKEFPSYSIAVNDPKEFINLYSTYRTKPIFKVEIKGGFNFCMPKFIEPFGVGNTSKGHPTYKSKLGYNVEVDFINKLYKDFEYSIGASLTLSNFDYSNKPFEYSTVTGTFKNNYLGLPVAVRYNYKFKTVNLFTKVGLEFVYLFQSSVNLTRTDINVGRSEPYTGIENLLLSHKKFDVRPLLAIGTALKVRNAQFLITAGFKFSTITQLNRQKAYSNPLLQEKYFFVEDELLLNQSFISFSYIQPIYKPKKIR